MEEIDIEDIEDNKQLINNTTSSNNNKLTDKEIKAIKRCGGKFIQCFRSIYEHLRNNMVYSRTESNCLFYMYLILIALLIISIISIISVIVGIILEIVE